MASTNTPQGGDALPSSPASTLRQRPTALATGAGAGAGAGAASPAKSPALSDEAVARLALARMRKASLAKTTRKVGGAITTAQAAKRLKAAAAVRISEKKEEAEAAAAAAAKRPLLPRVLNTMTFLFCDPGFTSRAVRFVALLLAIHMLAYWGWGMSVTIGIGLVFFYNGWHTENVRIAKAEKDMQRRFDETVDFRSLKNLPEWLITPSAEKADWLNSLLAKLWPKMREAIAASIAASLEPTLEEYCPSFLSKLGIDKLELGDKPIRITGVSRYDTEMDGAMLDLHVEWKGNPHIVVGVAAGVIYLPIELLNLTFAARLRVCFVHMTKDWPCFGAVSISFVGKPEIDFSLKAAKMDIMSIPGVGSWLENFIKDTLVWLMVWPTVMHIPILEGSQYLEDVSPGASGYGFLQVTLVSSKGLKKTAEPYCVVLLTNSPGGAAANQRTTGSAEYMSASDNHQWDAGQSFNLMVTDPFTQKLEVKLWDRKSMRKDLLKGTCLFDIHHLAANTPVLLTQDAVPHERANVTVELTYMPFVKGDGESKDGRSRAATDDSDPTSRLRGSSAARLEGDGTRPIGALTVNLHKASNLPRMDRFGKSDPYCVLSCGKKSWKSRVIKKSLNPEWQEECTLLVFRVQDEMLLLEMFDSDDIGSDDFMGRVRIPVADVVDDGRVNNKTFPLEEAKKGDVTLSIRWREL